MAPLCLCLPLCDVIFHQYVYSVLLLLQVTTYEQIQHCLLSQNKMKYSSSLLNY